MEWAAARKRRIASQLVCTGKQLLRIANQNSAAFHFAPPAQHLRRKTARNPHLMWISCGQTLG